MSLSSSQVKSEKTLGLERKIQDLQEEIQKVLEHTKILLVKNEELTLIIKENEDIIEKNRVISNKQMEQIGLLEIELKKHLEYEDKLKKELEEKIRAEMYSSFSREFTETTEIKRKSIPKIVKNKLWISDFGRDKSLGSCYVCEKEIHITEFEAGHIVAVSKGGSDDISNLKPVCSSCNKSVGTDNLEDFKRKYFNFENITTSEINKYNFSYGKIKSLIINDKPLAIYEFSKIIIYVCELIGLEKFRELTRLNFISGCCAGNGYRYYSNIGLSIQGVSSNRAIYEICRLLDLSKIKYLITIELRDAKVIKLLNKF